MTSRCTKEDRVLLQLTAAGMGNGTTCDIPDEVDWITVFNKSEEHSVNAIVADGINNIMTATGKKILEDISPEEDYRKFQWYAQIAATEQNHKLYAATIEELGVLLRHHDIKMMVLKGYGCSLNYPIPNHRIGGDIDIYLLDANKKDVDTRDITDKANRLFHDVLHADINDAGHHHSRFQRKGIGIENHVTILDIDSHASSIALERILEKLAEECVQGEYPECSYYLPSAKFNSIHLLRHMASDFATVCISLRQILDWATMVVSTSKDGDMDWEFTKRIAHDHNMHRFLDMVNMICVDYLHYSSELFPIEKRDEALCLRVMDDIMCPANRFWKSAYQTPVAYYIAKTKRLISNRWKYNMVYRENIVGYLLRKIRNASLH